MEENQITIDEILNCKDFLVYANENLNKSYAELMLIKPDKLRSMYKEFKRKEIEK